MIAEVAQAKRDVNTVGPNATALLKYIRVVGVDIDLKVAERIWATGVVPPLPSRKAQGGTTSATAKPVGVQPPGMIGQGNGPNGAVKPGAKTVAVPLAAPKPTQGLPTQSASTTALQSTGGVKRKLDESIDSSTINKTVINGTGATGISQGVGAEAKKAKIEAV